MQGARQRQETEAFATEYARRQGIEGTLSQGVRAFGLRRARYRGRAKTHVQHIATGQSLLLNTDLVTPVASIPISGMGTDVAIVSVDGKVEINTGSSKGTVARDPITPNSSGVVKQINWRDVPGTN